MPLDLASRRQHARTQFLSHIQHLETVRPREHGTCFTTRSTQSFRGTGNLTSAAYDPQHLAEAAEKPAYVAPVPTPIRETPTLDRSDMRKFLTSPLPEGVLMQCYVKRNRKAGLGKLFPVFELYEDYTNQFLCATKKKPGSKVSNYSLSLGKKSFEKDVNFLGKLRSNFVGTEFMIWEASQDQKNEKRETGVVVYESNFSPLNKGPRSMVAVVPGLRGDGTRKRYNNPTKTSILAKELRDMAVAQRRGLPRAEDPPIVMVNKEPAWSEQMGAFVLDFEGRVKLPSIKNFQLVNQDDANTTVLQFGRVSKDKFNMDFRHPFSPMQAFLMCISTFDYKLAPS